MQIKIATLHVRDSAQAVPLAAGNLKARLPREQQPHTELIDLFPEQSDAEICSELLSGAPDLIAFPLYVWNREQILRLCRSLKQTQPEIFLLAGGPEASADSLKVIVEGELDAVIRGEGEEAFTELVRRLGKDEPLAGIPGLVLAEAKRESAATSCPDLAKLPSPWLTGTLPLEDGSGVLWEVARGCRFNCAFCYDAKGQSGVRPLPLERLRHELELFARSGVSQVWVLDSTFNAPAERGKQLLKLLARVAPEIHYHIEAKADLLDDATIRLLAPLSCSVQIGLQSADPEVLKPLHRNLDHRQMEQVLRKLSRAGITFGLDLIYGLPGDNHAGFVRSLDFALHQQPNQLDIFPLAVLPGTELFEEQARYGIQGAPRPPYLIQENAGYPPKEMAASQKLAAATDIFYNRGRAVGFFLQLCRALRCAPQEFLSGFGAWLEKQKKISATRLLDIESWHPREILPLQLDYSGAKLREKKLTKLLPVAEDLIAYHFCCAEVLLAEDCLLAAQVPDDRTLLQTEWRLNPGVLRRRFNHPLEGLEELGGESLEEIARHLPRETEEVIFLRRGGELMIEAIAEEFAHLLERAEKPAPGSELSAGLPKRTALELLRFAVGEGVLIH